MKIATNDQTISGAFRVRNPKQHFSSSGQEYVACVLEDTFRSINAYARLGDYNGIPLTKNHQLIWGRFSIRSANGSSYADLIYAEPLIVKNHRVIDLLPCWGHPSQNHVVALHEITSSLTTSSLFSFVNNVLCNEDILLKYLSAPASISHHHNHPGGLLEHSTEVATIVSRHTEFPRKILEIAMVAALFHDIGKIRLMTADMRYTPIGALLKHEDLTLEILSEPLMTLEKEDHDAATALRYLLSWNPAKEARPKITVAEAIRSADRISSGLNAEAKAFEGHPSYHRYAVLDCRGPKSRFWRLDEQKYNNAVN